MFDLLNAILGNSLAIRRRYVGRSLPPMRSGGWRASTKFALKWSDAGVDMKPLSDRLSTVAGRIRRVRVRAVQAASSLAPLRGGRCD